MSIRSIGDNLFAFQFFHELDKKKVMDSAPWHVDNYLLVLEEAKGHLTPSEIELHQSQFWVRVKDVPLAKRNAQTA